MADGLLVGGVRVASVLLGITTMRMLISRTRKIPLPNPRRGLKQPCTSRPSTILEFLQSLESKHVRDLVCALAMPCMVTPEEQEAFLVSDGKELVLSNWKWITDLDANPTELVTEVKKDKSARILGNYFARMWEYFIEHAPCRAGSLTPVITELKSRLQVFEQNRTIGAFDLSFRSNETDLEHWEVSFKCKLYVPPESKRAPIPSLSWCSGPHQSETLQDKVNKVKRQLKLGHTSSGTSTFKKYYPWWKPEERKVKTVCVLNGVVLYPILTEKWPSEKEVISSLRTKTLRGPSGWWTENLEILPAKSLWYVLPKLCWLSPLTPYVLENLRSTKILMTTTQLRKELSRLREEKVDMTQEEKGRRSKRRSKLEKVIRRRRVYVAEVLEEDGYLVERSRGFIVEPGWERNFRNLKLQTNDIQ